MSNGLASLPRYKYDPVTQTYQLLSTPPDPYSATQQGSYYDPRLSDGDGPGAVGSPSAGFGQGISSAAQSIGLGMMGYGENTMGLGPGAALAGMVGSAIAGQQADAMAAAMTAAQAAAPAADIGIGTFSDMEGNVGSFSSPASINAADMATFGETAAAISGLAGMNAAQAAEAESADSAADAAAAAAAAAAASEGSEGEGAGEGAGEGGAGASAGGAGEGADGGGSDGGGGSGEGGSAGGAGEGADGSGSGSGSDGGGSGGDGGDGERAGGLIGNKRYQMGGGVFGMGDAQPQYAYPPVMMAKGGIAAARQAQKYGRGQDTMLVHMTPKEVAGLQALALSRGGSLTINPHTGLPEAGFLSSILPMAAGFALTAATGIPAWQAGLLVGGGTALMTGSLQKGLMAGLGAFGGAGLGGALVTAGSQAGSLANLMDYGAGFDQLGEAAASGLAETGTTAAASSPTALSGPELVYKETLGMTGDPNAALRAAQTSVGLAEGAPAEALAYGTKDFTYGDLGAGVVTPQTPADTLAYKPRDFRFDDLAQNLPPRPENMTMSQRLSAAQEGVTGLTTAPGRERFMTAVGGGKGLLQYGLPAISAPVTEMMQPRPLDLAGTRTASQIRPYTLDVTNLSATQAPLYTPTSTEEREMLRYSYSPMPAYRAAEGGEVDPDYNAEVGRMSGFSDGYEEGGVAKLAKMRKSLKGQPYYKFAQDRKDSSMEAAIEQNFAGGGALPPRFLSGGGDGMSDSIKANIDGKQEARLADGEFVVPADVVSHLGNGSSKAGAKKLYAMMDRIRSARTGQKKQAPEVKAERYMPA